ncbi:hypothetical protein Lesp01_83760 [Lentzea sp. NBRC 102530]|nr:hypothetical protein Lesp01_83760 [Lentzea sp. NBRC 102530]
MACLRRVACLRQVARPAGGPAGRSDPSRGANGPFAPALRLPVPALRSLEPALRVVGVCFAVPGTHPAVPTLRYPPCGTHPPWLPAPTSPRHPTSRLSLADRSPPKPPPAGVTEPGANRTPRSHHSGSLSSSHPLPPLDRFCKSLQV